MPTPKSNAASKTFLELQASDVRNAFDYLRVFGDVLNKTEVTRVTNMSADPIIKELTLNDGVYFLISSSLEKFSFTNQKLFVIGNGGSAAIALHTLQDYANIGGLETVDLFNPSLLTCMANDYGYENVFAKPIELFADDGDVIFAISSSGKSLNIVKACELALEKKCLVVTFSGFSRDNYLRKLGHLNFYVPSTHYGFVELSHQVLIHCILDLFVRKKVYERARETIG